jgi:hypothetical protein
LIKKTLSNESAEDSKNEDGQNIKEKIRYVEYASKCESAFFKKIRGKPARAISSAQESIPSMAGRPQSERRCAAKRLARIKLKSPIRDPLRKAREDVILF